MTDAAPETTAEAPAQKTGRGPTRPAIIAADLIETIEKAGQQQAAEFVMCVSQQRTAKRLRDDIRDRRKTLEAHVRRVEASIRDETALAEMLAESERLTPAMRAFVVAAVTPKDAPTQDGEDPVA